MPSRRRPLSEALSEIGPSTLMTSIQPSSNWFALQKSLPRKRRKIESPSDKASAFPRDIVSPPSTRREPDSHNEHIDLETTEVKNGESIATLRRMVLGRVDYKASQTAPGKYLALDCEMVGVGIEGNESSLARVSIVNYTGAIVLDAFVRQREKVVDYRTQWSGVRSADLAASAKPFKQVQQTVADLIKDRILVGHAIHNDLKALLLSHPSPQIRDTQSLAYKHRVVKSRRPALRVLAKQELGIVIQGGEHSSVTDARATMALFRLYKKEWESSFRPFHAPAHQKSKRDDLADETVTVSRSSLPSNSFPSRGKKRKHSESPEFDGDDGPQSRALSPSLSSAPDSRSPTRHISTLPKRDERKSRSQPSADSTQRKGVSSGISRVTRRVGGVKEVRRKGTRTGNDGERGGKSGEQWWKSLGGSKEGRIRL